MTEHPPSGAAGQPLIARQLLEGYDMRSLDILCDARFHPSDAERRRTLLRCRHTVIRNAEGVRAFRPRRLVSRVADNVNALRVGPVTRAGVRLVHRRGVEAILAVPWRCEFAVAALQISRQTGVPLYVFEMDDWEAMNTGGLPRRLARRYHAEMLRTAHKVWLISPQMVAKYASSFGVQGEFLFHHVDVEAYRRASEARSAPAATDPLNVVYTGAINDMFLDAMRVVCAVINRGIVAHGRLVELSVYGGSCPDDLLGPHVHYRGHVAPEAIPAVLAQADVTLIAISFSQDPNIRALVKTSIYTKTVGYLASGRPLLVVAPPDSAEIAYFGGLAEVVDELDDRKVRDAVTKLGGGSPEVRERSARGVAFVRDHHSLESLDRVFLDHFR